MATLTTQIYEILTLEGNDIGSSAINTINGINNVDNRIVTCGSGSWTQIFQFDDIQYPTTPATFATGSFKYGRVTNLSNTNILVDIVTYDLYTAENLHTEMYLTPGSSFMLSSALAYNSGSTQPNAGEFTLNQYIQTIQVAPFFQTSGGGAAVEYYIATT